jgi:hypothetical protein
MTRSTPRASLAEAAAERVPLAAPAVQSHDIGAGGAGHRAAVVGRPVVDDEHGAVTARAAHDVAEAPRLVEDRDHDQVVAHAG